MYLVGSFGFIAVGLGFYYSSLSSSELTKYDNLIGIVTIIPHIWNLWTSFLSFREWIRVSELTKDDYLVWIRVMIPPRHDDGDDRMGLRTGLMFSRCYSEWLRVKLPGPGPSLSLSSSRNWGFLTQSSWLTLSRGSGPFPAPFLTPLKLSIALFVIACPFILSPKIINQSSRFRNAQVQIAIPY